MTVREWGRRGRDTCFPRLGRSPAPAAAPWLPRGRSRLSRSGRRAAGRPQTPPSALPPFPPACPGARSVLHRQGAGAASRRRGPIGRGGDAGEEARRRVGFLLATRGGEGEPEQLGRKRSANGRRRRRLPSASGSTDRGEAEGGRARRRGGREAGETGGEAAGAAAERGEDGGRLGGTGHPPAPSSSAHRATAGRGRPRGAPVWSWRVPPRGGRGQDGSPERGWPGSEPPPPRGHLLPGVPSPACAEGGATPAPGAPTRRWHWGRGLHAGALARECGLSAPKRRGCS